MPKQYVVEAITDTKIKDGERFYHVKWEGFKVATWEPTEAVKGCVEMLRQFSTGKHALKPQRAQKAPSASQITKKPRNRSSEQNTSARRRKFAAINGVRARNSTHLQDTTNMRSPKDGPVQEFPPSPVTFKRRVFDTSTGEIVIVYDRNNTERELPVAQITNADLLRAALIDSMKNVVDHVR